MLIRRVTGDARLRKECPETTEKTSSTNNETHTAAIITEKDVSECYYSPNVAVRICSRPHKTHGL